MDWRRHEGGGLLLERAPSPMAWAAPGIDFERELRAAPEHVQRNLRRAAEQGGPFEPRASGNSWQETVYPAGLADGTPITNSVTEAVMVPDFALPAGYLVAGRILKFSLWGRVSTVVTTPGTITFRLRWGGVAGTVLVASKAQRPKVTVSTNVSGYVEFIVAVRSIGLTGSALAQGYCTLGNTIGDAQAAQEQVWPDVPAAVSIDTTTAKALSPTLQFSVATATTSWTTHIARLESLN